LEDFVSIIFIIFTLKKEIFLKLNNNNSYWGLGIGDWGLGIGDWGLGPIPNPHMIDLILKSYYLFKKNKLIKIFNKKEYSIYKKIIYFLFKLWQKKIKKKKNQKRYQKKKKKRCVL
jgi:hypothetical protein